MITVSDPTPTPTKYDAAIAAGNDKAYAATVNGQEAIKCGSGSAKGAATITLAHSEVSTLYVHVGGWKGDTGKSVVVTSSTGTVAPSSISVTLLGIITEVRLVQPLKA